MINDTDRNDFYWRALKASSLEGKMVLDLGSGSGILSIMAAQLGARRVVGVEDLGLFGKLRGSAFSHPTMQGSHR